MTSYTGFFTGAASVAGALTGLLFVAAIIVMYAVQASTAFITRTAEDAAAQSATFVLIMFAAGITRSWELLGLRGGGPLDLLAQRPGNSDGGPPGEPLAGSRWAEVLLSSRPAAGFSLAHSQAS